MLCPSGTVGSNVQWTDTFVREAVAAIIYIIDGTAQNDHSKLLARPEPRRGKRK